jgi:hypothetical protein
MPPGGLVCGPVASMGRSRPEIKRHQGPNISTYALNSAHHGPLNAGTSVVLLVFFTYQDLDRVKQTQHDSRLIHVIHFFWQDSWVL